MKRLFDFVAAGSALVGFAPVMVLISALVALTSRGPVLYRSQRVGLRNRLFWMYKFRTMRAGTPAVATHLLEHPEEKITPVGRFLRRTSLDELPQLLNVIRGEMSLVGPRPALFNQQDLVLLRTERGVDALLPGITGWAQVNGRDELPVPHKVDYDVYYLKNRTFRFDLRILWLTVVKVLRRDGVAH